MTLAAVVALTLAACSSDTASTTTAEDTRGWSDEAFRDLMTYCQATEHFGLCANLIITIRDIRCSVEATYLIIDVMVGFAFDEREEPVNDLMRGVLQPTGDCLGYDESVTVVEAANVIGLLPR